MRLADADLLPFEFSDFADTVQTYLKELKTLSQKCRTTFLNATRKSKKAFSRPPMTPSGLLCRPAEAVRRT